MRKAHECECGEEEEYCDIGINESNPFELLLLRMYIKLIMQQMNKESP